MSLLNKNASCKSSKKQQRREAVYFSWEMQNFGRLPLKTNEVCNNVSRILSPFLTSFVFFRKYFHLMIHSKLLSDISMQ